MDLIADDEHSTTVEAALAFIDSCVDSSVAGAGEGPVKLVAALPGASALEDTAAESIRSSRDTVATYSESSGSSLQQKRTRNAVASSRSRKKRQMELLVLREEETLLRARLLALEERRLVQGYPVAGSQVASSLGSPSVPMSVSPAPTWRRSSSNEIASESMIVEQADLEQRRRHRSEALNQRLRAAVRKQRSVTQYLAKLAQKRLDLKELGELLQTASETSSQSALTLLEQKCAPHPTSGLLVVDKHAVLADLTRRLGPQVLDVQLALGTLGAPADELVEFISRSKHLTGLGRLVELSSTTPLACSLEQAWVSLTGFIRGVQAETAYQSVERRLIDDQTYKKEYEITFEDPQFFGPVVVDSITLVKEAGSESYRAFLWSAAVRPPSGSFSIRVNGWVGLSRSAASPSRRCVYRQQIEICAETSTQAIDTDDTMPSAQRGITHSLQDFVLTSMVTKVQQNQRKLADAMERKHSR